MRFVNFAIVRFSLCLMAGIATAHQFPNFPFFYSLPALLVLLGVFWFIARKQLFQQVYFGIVTYLCFFCIGVVNYQLRLPSFQPEHYTHAPSEKESTIIQLQIKEILKPDAYNTKYSARVLLLDSNNVTGFILLSLRKDSTNTHLNVDDLLIVQGHISEISKPLNPHQFDYSAYMKTLDVYGQLRISTHEILKKENGASTLRGHAGNLRSYLIKKLENTSIQTEERSIIQALILGQRSGIGKELYTAYIAAGAVHILAVSGLHVGIIYFILKFLLRPLGYFRYGKKLQYLLLILLLWGFACITGLSPSVTRAVTMFSFFGVANLLNRPTNSINTLFLSLFFLLLFNPKWLFHVGFQLSYLAVFFILWIQPKLSAYYTPKFYVDKLLWGILTVTIAAQLGVAPLSLYYFHQFPGLFFISNLIILPFLGILICGGVLIILLAAFDILPERMAIWYNYLIELLNNFIGWIASQKQFLITDINFSGYQLIGTYLVIVTVVLAWRRYSYKRLVTVLVSIAILLAFLILNKYKTSNVALVVFQKNRKTLITLREAATLTVYSNDTTFNFRNTYPLKSYRTAINSSIYIEKSVPDILVFKSKLILIIDSTGVYPKHSGIDIVILTESPKVHLERLIDSLKPKLIIADGSNYRSYVARWEETCKTRKLPFHQTGNGGAFILE